jgi:ApaG protein
MEKSTQQIGIVINSHYIAEQSLPEKEQFVFAYTIKIKNLGTKAAKLLTRHWVITDANGKVEEVHGEGVVGKQPYLNPGEEFQYTSGAILETPVGTMQGNYEMLTSEGIRFEAEIPVFRLSVPNLLH